MGFTQRSAASCCQSNAFILKWLLVICALQAHFWVIPYLVWWGKGCKRQTIRHNLLKSLERSWKITRCFQYIVQIAQKVPTHPLLLYKEPVTYLSVTATLFVTEIGWLDKQLPDAMTFQENRWKFNTIQLAK